MFIKFQRHISILLFVGVFEHLEVPFNFKRSRISQPMQESRTVIYLLPPCPFPNRVFHGVFGCSIFISCVIAFPWIAKWRPQDLWQGDRHSCQGTKSWGMEDYFLIRSAPFPRSIIFVCLPSPKAIIRTHSQKVQGNPRVECFTTKCSGLVHAPHAVSTHQTSLRFIARRLKPIKVQLGHPSSSQVIWVFSPNDPDELYFYTSL